MKKITHRSRLTALLLGSSASVALAGCDNSNDVVFVEDSPPAVPSGVYTITGDGQVEVLWNPVRGNNVEGYGVYRSDTTIDGAYHRLDTVLGEESSSYIDRDVVNGNTYFYAVDAFNFQGQESELSYEDAFDTPRPAGQAQLLWAKEVDPTRSGLDLSAFNTKSFVRGYDHEDADFFIQRIVSGPQGVLYAKGKVHGAVWNDLQDLGYTDSLDEISWAPADGWSVAPAGVELIVGHTYVVWTWNEHFAKFRVVDIVVDTKANLPSAVEIDWAYQVDDQNPELSPLFMTRVGASGREREES